MLWTWGMDGSHLTGLVPFTMEPTLHGCIMKTWVGSTERGIPWMIPGFGQINGTGPGRMTSPTPISLGPMGIGYFIFLEVPAPLASLTMVSIAGRQA